MGIIDGGISGVGYSCGCEWRSDGNHAFCDNPEHKRKECGCHNLGGNSTLCKTHAFWLYMMVVGVGLMFGSALVLVLLQIKISN